MARFYPSFRVHVSFCFPSWSRVFSRCTFSFVTMAHFRRNCNRYGGGKLCDDFTRKQKRRREKKNCFCRSAELPLSELAVCFKGISRSKSPHSHHELTSARQMGNRRKSPRFALKTAATPSQPDTAGSQVQVGRSRDRRALWGNHGWLICRRLRADVTTFILPAVTQITAPTHPPPPVLSVTSSCRLAALCLHLSCRLAALCLPFNPWNGAYTLVFPFNAYNNLKVIL